MDQLLKKKLYVILLSLGLAFTFNYLFFNKTIGISVFIFTMFFLGAISLFAHHEKISLKKSGWILFFIAFFSLMPSIRENPFLIFLNICATLGLLMLLANELTGISIYLMKLRDYVALIIITPFRMLAGALSTISVIGQIHSKVENRDVWFRVFRGVIMAAPILVIFAILFSQADLVFSQFLKGFININISERTAQYIALLAFSFVASLCFISYLFFSKPRNDEQSSNQSHAPVQTGRGIEALVFLGLISTLFLMFIVFQITYLFGGETNIINAGFTYSEYARKGFGELLAVAIISLFVLLASEKYVGEELQKNKKFVIPSVILVVEVGVIIYAAFKRLTLYIDAYGMTLLRFYVAGFILLLFAVFSLLAIKFIKTKKEQFFTFGVLLSVVCFLGIINIINPDAFIAKANIAEYNQTGKIDASYLRELSADAESLKINLFETLEGENKEVIRELLLKDKERLEKSRANWQSLNYSRTRALKQLEELGSL